MQSLSFKGRQAHPLYFFAEDGAPGDTKSQGLDAFGAEWYVLAPDGSKIEQSDDSGDNGY